MYKVNGARIALFVFMLVYSSVVKADAVGLWTFDGVVGESIPIGTTFQNRIDPTKLTARAANHYNSTASTSHLSSFLSFADAPFNAIRTGKYGSDDIAVNSAFHMDGKWAKGQGCPIYIDDPDGDLDLSSFTVELFVRWSSNTQTWTKYFTRGCKVGSSTPAAWDLFTADYSEFRFVCRCVTNEAGSVRSVTTSFGKFNTLTDCKWHHVAVSFDGTTKELKFWIDHSCKSTKTLPGPLSYGDAGGTKYPVVFGNDTTSSDAWSWPGDIAAIRVSNAALTGNEMLWTGSSIANGKAIMHLPFDGDFCDIGFGGGQTTNGTRQTGVLAALTSGKASFKPLPGRKSVVSESGRMIRPGDDTSYLSLAGTNIVLNLSPFKVDLYNAFTVEFFLQADVNDIGIGWGRSFVAARHSTQSYAPLPLLVTAPNEASLGIRIDTPSLADADTPVKIASSYKPLDGKWHHVAITFEHNATHDKETVSAYFDYKKVSTHTKNGIFTLAGSNDTLSFGFSGSNCVMNFDEFRISRGVRDSSEMMKRKSGMVLIIR